MSGFILLTLSFTVAILLASAISTVTVFKLMSSDRFMNWFIVRYMKAVEKTTMKFEEKFENWDV